MRILEISSATRGKVDKVVAYARKRKNWYLAGPYRGHYVPEHVPGNNHRHQCQLNDYRCVFSYTVFGGNVWRHLSVSVPSDKFPHPAAIRAIAELFGFTGVEGLEEDDAFPSTWKLHIQKDHPINDDCIVVAEVTEIQL